MKMEYIFVKFVDDYCKSKEMFINFLSLNDHIIFKSINGRDTILFDEWELQYILDFIEVEKSEEIIFYLIVKSLGNEDEQAFILEKFDSSIKEINEKYGRQFSINTIWNDVSFYYGRKLYPDIVNVENMLRKIIYLFMLKTVGSKWLDTSTPEKFQQDISTIIEKNSKKRNEINEEWLIYADFITLGYFFTAPYALKSDLSTLFKEIEKYKDIELENKEKSKKLLTEKVIKELSDEYEPKNNWDRYFSDKLSVKSPNKFSKDWSSLYQIRNDVAHGKPIGKVEFDKATKLIDIFKKIFKECIDIIDTVEVTVEEAEAVESIAQQVIQKESQLEYTQKTTSSYSSSLDLGNMTRHISPYGYIGESVAAYIPRNTDNYKGLTMEGIYHNTEIPEITPREWYSKKYAQQIGSDALLWKEDIMSALEKPIYINHTFNFEGSKTDASALQFKADNSNIEKDDSKNN